MNPTKKDARTAGVLYLLLMFTGPFTLLYVPRVLIVRGDAAATASNILASEMLFRMGIAVGMISSLAFLFTALALYRLLKSVNQAHASAMVILVAISVAISVLNEVNNIAALILVRGADFLSIFSKPQRDALAMLFLRLHTQGITVNEMFWGLWLFPFGLLVTRSLFLPRILGLLLIVNGMAYVAICLTSLLLPDYAAVVNRAAMPAELGEIWITLWLLIKGIREPLPAVSREPAVA